MSVVAKIIIGLVVAVALMVVGMWVVGLGPFNTGPSAAAKALPKVAASVAVTQAKAGAAVAKAQDKTHTKIAAIEKRTETNVAKVRAAPPELSDRLWLDSLCQSVVYAGDPACRGLGGQPAR